MNSRQGEVCYWSPKSPITLHSVIATRFQGERMDRWLNDGPVLTYVKKLCAWVVINNKSERISWTDDPAELAWLSLWFSNTRQP